MQTYKQLTNWLATAFCISILLIPWQRLIAQEVTANNANSSLTQKQPTKLSMGVYQPIIHGGKNDLAMSVAAAGSLSTVVTNIPVSLVTSTIYLYWTQHDQSDDVSGGLITASIYRVGKDHIPGGGLRLLYSETEGADHIWPVFSTIVNAQVGVWYGYFIANYMGCSTSCPSFIKRIPLAGGAATILAQLPAAATNLKTDGAYLYWADATAVYRMPIQGGSITKLASRSGGSTLLDLGSSNVYFVDASKVIKRVPKTGGTTTTIANPVSAVSDLYVYVQPTQTTLYWSEVNGAVKSTVVGGATSTYQSALTGKTAKSVGFDGARVFWLTCATLASSQCTLIQQQGTVKTALVSNAGNDSNNLVWDATLVFWGSITGIKKYIQ